MVIAAQLAGCALLIAGTWMVVSLGAAILLAGLMLLTGGTLAERAAA